MDWIHLLIYWFIDSLIVWFIHSFIQSFIHWLIPSFLPSFIHSLICSLIHFPAGWFIDSLSWFQKSSLREAIGVDCIDESEVLTVADEGARMRPDFRHRNWEFLWKDQGKTWHKPWKNHGKLMENPWEYHVLWCLMHCWCVSLSFYHDALRWMTQDDRLSMVSRANSQTTSSSKGSQPTSME